jgi:hypothetical protein
MEAMTLNITIKKHDLKYEILGITLFPRLLGPIN